MLGECFDIVNNGIFGVLDLFSSFLDSLGAWSFIFAVIVAMSVIRFIVYPFLKGGVAGSDSVRGRKNDRELERKNKA